MKVNIWEKIKNMSMRTKRLIALAVCLVLLAVAVVQNASTDRAEAGNTSDVGNVNISTGNGDENKDLLVDKPANVGSGVINVDDAEEYFATIRLNKLNDRSETEESCNEIIDSEAAAEETVAEAVAQMESLKKIAKTEESLETNIMSRGYEDVFVIIENDCVYITVAADSLDVNEASAIAVSACEIAGCEMDDVILKGVY
jgi:hypothetical protein